MLAHPLSSRSQPLQTAAVGPDGVAVLQASSQLQLETRHSCVPTWRHSQVMVFIGTAGSSRASQSSTSR
eukprot:997004-Heterocapsa_arctica.AAC.1